MDGSEDVSPALAALCTPEVMSDSDLFFVHLDERERSVTLGFARQNGGEGFEFFLRFPQAREVRVRGWAHPGRKDVRVADDGDGVEVVVSAPGSSLSFRAAGVALARTRSFPVWERLGP
ncbi:hypothetical protein ACFW9D_11210 [Streptomyces sp. NPDC059524]|uniref:hypothetical protein n=1 Tax=Streptomyces sp. NPDC059524 TaxID=3346856 RepID=UPI0036B1F5EA